MSVEVRIEDVRRIEAERRAINGLDFDDIVWTEGGTPIYINPAVQERWALCGLNNCDFISTGAYTWQPSDIGLEEKP